MGDCEDLEERDRDRYRVLHAMYKLTGGVSRLVLKTRDEVVQLTGLPEERVEDAIHYLCEEGLLEYVTNDGIAILHPAVLEVEASIRRPSQPTEHFEPSHFVINNHFNAPVGAVQHGAGSVANVTQNIGREDDLTRLFAALRAELADVPPEKREQVNEAVTAMEAEARKEKPNKRAFMTFLGFLTGFVSDYGANVLGDITTNVLQAAGG